MSKDTTKVVKIYDMSTSTVKEKSLHTPLYVDFFPGDFHQIVKGVIALFKAVNVKNI